MSRKISREEAIKIIRTRQDHVPEDQSTISDYEKDMGDDEEWDLVFGALDLANQKMHERFWTPARRKRQLELHKGGWKIDFDSSTCADDSKIMFRAIDDKFLHDLKNVSKGMGNYTRSKWICIFLLIGIGIGGIFFNVTTPEILGALLFTYLLHIYLKNRNDKYLEKAGEAFAE